MNACCGLNCANCPTYLATQQDDHAAREKVAAQWSRLFGFALKPDDINCDGCQSGSARMFGFCKSCQVRSCCQSKGLETCADCRDCPCDQLTGLFAIIPDAKKGIEAIRAARQA